MDMETRKNTHFNNLSLKLKKYALLGSVCAYIERKWIWIFRI